MLDIAVIEDPATAESLLDPVRTRLLEALAEPASATMLASRVGLPRQLVNYHLRTLERHGLVELEAERRKGNVTERIMRASAGSYVISPAALTGLQPDPRARPISARPSGCWRWGPVWSATSARSWPGRPASDDRCPPSPWTPRSASPAPRTGPRSRTSSRPR